MLVGAAMGDGVDVTDCTVGPGVCSRTTLAVREFEGVVTSDVGSLVQAANVRMIAKNPNFIPPLLQ